MIMATYNVKDFGAIGDGTNDDTQFIQAAMDLAKQIKGGTVFFPPGKYLVTSTLELNGLASIEGSGWSTNSMEEGSFIFFKESFSGDVLNITGRNATVNQLGFACDQPQIGLPMNLVVGLLFMSGLMT